MTLEVSLAESTWNLSSSTEAEEIVQNVRCLLTSVRGTVYLYRDFGLDARLLDLPVNVVAAKFTASVAKAIAKYEPRARLKKILWRTSEAVDGKLEPVILIEVQSS